MGAEEEGAKPLGERLREQRELRKVSLEEISKVTKISIHMLHAMENDNWDALPGGIFTRNFIRLYANQLGLESERWVDEFKEQTKKQRAEVQQEEQQQQEKEKVEISPSWLYFLLIVIILLLVGGYFAIIRMSSTEKPSQPAEESAVEAATQASPLAQTLVEEKQEGLQLELTETEVNRTFWYKWWADGQLETDAGGASVGQGTKVVIQARNKIELHMNHYRSIDARLNGRKLDWDTLHVEPRVYEGGATTYTVVITLENLK
jgi:cytoskeletal protein RodZ